MPEKLFKIDAADGTISPKSHSLSIREKEFASWAITGGKGVVIFQSEKATPVMFKTGPEVLPEAPALAVPIVPGIHPHWIRLWADNGRGREVIVPAVLIIDP